MKGISEPFIRRPVMTLLLTLSAIVFGVLAYRSLPVNDLPAVDYPVITVRVGYPGASPETVANTIATPLERQFMQINGLEMVTSSSAQGYCSLTLQFDISKSIDAAATDVQTAISQAGGMLPQDLPSPPTFSKTNPNDQPIFFIALTSDTLPMRKLYELASTHVGQRISIISGVSSVQVYGSKSAVRIKADSDLLSARNMTMDQLTAAIRAGTGYTGAGQFDGKYKTFLIEPQGQLETADEYNNLIIDTRNGAPIYLRDVATATDSIQDERVNMRFWMRDHEVPKATVILAVSRQAGANAVEVAKSIQEVAERDIKNNLPPSVSIFPIYNRSKTIINSVNDVRDTLFIAFFLVIIVIYIFLGRVTDTMIPIVALPLSLLLTFLVMKALGYSLNNLTLMALTLAIGFLVDDAIVFLENTVRRMEHTSEGPMTASINSAKQISFTILAMTLSLATVFLPMILLSGIMGRVFREFAVTIVVSIIASGVVSLSLTPLMCSRMLGARGHGARKSIMERVFGVFERMILDAYGYLLWFFLKQRWISVLLWAGCMYGTWYCYNQIPKSFLAKGDSSFVVGPFIAKEGTSPDQIHQMQKIVESIATQNPNVELVFTVSGASGFMNSNMGFFIAVLKEPGKRKPIPVDPSKPDGAMRQPTIEEINSDLTQTLFMSVPGAITIPQAQPVLEISTGGSSRLQGEYSYIISGLNPAEVHTAAQKMQMHLMQSGLFSSVQSDMYKSFPKLKVNILREQAAAYNISVTRIEALLRTAFSQNYTYLIKQADDQYQVIVEAKDNQRTDPEDIDKLYITSDDGKNSIPLKSIIDTEWTTSPITINHFNQFTSETLSVSPIPGVNIDQVTTAFNESARLAIPSNLRSKAQGQAEVFEKTKADLQVMMIFAVFAMYVILGILYESFIHPITVLSTLPPALIGGLATLLFFGQTASLYAFIGLFMLMGIVKKNGIMIVDFANQRVLEGMKPMDAIHEASLNRFRPIVMTTLAAVMGALPIALGYGADGAGRRPLGLVIVGGLLVSQLITLFVTPPIYLIMESFQQFWTRHFTRKSEETLAAEPAEPLYVLPK